MHGPAHIAQGLEDNSHALGNSILDLAFLIVHFDLAFAVLNQIKTKFEHFLRKSGQAQDIQLFAHRFIIGATPVVTVIIAPVRLFLRLAHGSAHILYHGQNVFLPGLRFSGTQGSYLGSKARGLEYKGNQLFFGEFFERGFQFLRGRAVSSLLRFARKLNLQVEQTSVIGGGKRNGPLPGGESLTSASQGNGMLTPQSVRAGACVCQFPVALSENHGGISSCSVNGSQYAAFRGKGNIANLSGFVIGVPALKRGFTRPCRQGVGRYPIGKMQR